MSNKLARFLAIQDILKIQEKKMLAEFYDLQVQRDSIVRQIDELGRYREATLKKLADKKMHQDELTSINKFSNQVEQSLINLRNNYEVVNSNCEIVHTRLAEGKRTLLSIEKLIEKKQHSQNIKLEKAEQTSLEEYLLNQQGHNQAYHYNE